MITWKSWVIFLVPLLVALAVGFYIASFSPTTESVNLIDPLGKYIDKLAHEFECEGCPSLYRRVDDNGYYSYGCLQFQKATFIEQVKKYDLLPHAELHEYDNLIYDCDFQKSVARKMFENDPNAYKHWRTSIIKRGLGMPPLLTLNK